MGKLSISEDASSVLWTNWQEQLKELLTGIHGHQKKTLAFFVLGIILSGCAMMQLVAETLSERGLNITFRGFFVHMRKNESWSEHLIMRLRTIYRVGLNSTHLLFEESIAQGIRVREYLLFGPKRHG